MRTQQVFLLPLLLGSTLAFADEGLIAGSDAANEPKAEKESTDLNPPGPEAGQDRSEDDPIAALKAWA